MKNTREVIYPERSAQIKEVGGIQTFQPGDGGIIYGVEVIMSNGDSFSHWTTDKTKIQFFKEGSYLVYRLKKTIENEGTEKEKIKNRLDNFDFILPRKVRAEMEIPKKIVDSASFSVSYAQQILNNNSELFIKDGKLDIKLFRKNLSELACSMHEQTKALLLAEDFGDLNV